jgi:SAM-dependent methyltransferase
MQRVVEPELMDDDAQALAYARADFSEPNQRFVASFSESFPRFAAGSVLDLGCGPGDIVLRLADALPHCQVHGLDGSAPMLAHAAAALRARPDLADRVRFIEGLLPDPTLPLPRYDAVISNSLLHHLHEPAVLWRAVRECGQPGAAVLVMDLYRPPSLQQAQAVVDLYAAHEPEILRRDFYNSLCAAFEPAEVRCQLADWGLHTLEVRTVSDRHLLISGHLPA